MELQNYPYALADLNSCINTGYRNDGSYFLRASANIELGKFAEAVQDLTEAIRMDSTKTAYYLYRATCLLTVGKYHDAVNDYDTLIKTEPSARYYNARGMAQMALDHWQEAADDFTQAIALEHNLVSSYLNRASAHQQLHKLEAALADLDQAMQLDPTNDRAFIARGNLNLHLGQVADAISDYSRAIEINPSEAGYYQNRGSARMLAAGYGNGAEPLNDELATPAMEDFNKSVTLNLTYADGFASRARLHNALKQYDEALQDSTHAIALDQYNAIAFVERALAYRNLGKAELADLDLQQAKSLGWN
jgi:tetratricopeptide (TPR) repeat protein